MTILDVELQQMTPSQTVEMEKFCESSISDISFFGNLTTRQIKMRFTAIICPLCAKKHIISFKDLKDANHVVRELKLENVSIRHAIVELLEESVNYEFLRPLLNTQQEHVDVFVSDVHNADNDENNESYSIRCNICDKRHGVSEPNIKQFRYEISSKLLLEQLFLPSLVVQEKLKRTHLVNMSLEWAYNKHIDSLDIINHNKLSHDELTRLNQKHQQHQEALRRRAARVESDRLKTARKSPKKQADLIVPFNQLSLELAQEYSRCGRKVRHDSHEESEQTRLANKAHHKNTYLCPYCEGYHYGTPSTGVPMTVDERGSFLEFVYKQDISKANRFIHRILFEG